MKYFVAVFLVPVAVLLCGVGGHTIGVEYVSAGAGTAGSAALFGGMAGLFYSVLAVRGLTAADSPFVERSSGMGPVSGFAATAVAVLAISLGILAIRSEGVRRAFHYSWSNVCHAIQAEIDSWEIGEKWGQVTQRALENSTEQ